MNVYEYFTDPVLRGPTVGCMLMCFGAALVGVIVFLRKESLVGEALSHAAYPGVILGVAISGFLSLTEMNDIPLSLLSMSGAFLTAFLGLWFIRKLQTALKVRNDSALCFVLSVFFGSGLTLASQIQFSYSNLYKQALVYLYGQAATMTDLHILVYGILAVLIVWVVSFLYKEIQVITFDSEYAQSLGLRTKSVDFAVFTLIILAVIIGIRSVGVVLMSAMLIAPAAAARQYSHKLYWVFLLSGFFGIFSGFLGNYLSNEGSILLAHAYPQDRISIPTGPMIVMVASAICLFSLLFAPERGLLSRLIRIGRFRYHCICENVLKNMWRMGPEGLYPFGQVIRNQPGSRLYLHFLLLKLRRNGWVETPSRGLYRLSHEGKSWAAKIVRLHRLWEVYLADYLGIGAEKVHRNAEEMEHIITPDIERELVILLKDPKIDPHHQPIPPKEVF